DNAPPALDLLVGLIFYPLYVGALILFLDGAQPSLTADCMNVLVHPARRLFFYSRHFLTSSGSACR
ncbi:hypothetical protein, partial [Vibrio cholerae]|uniref:hypothetical protein n=1 Tax=Vibrio cholerae TaxID=666 RepID=UPI001C3E1705